MIQQHDEFLGAFKKDLNTFTRKLGGLDNKDPKLIKSFNGLAESMATNIAKRFGEYAKAYDLDKVAAQPQAGDFPTACGPTGPHSSHTVAHLEAELRRRTEEEERLQNELRERMNADSDAALHECNVEFLQARQVASDRAVQAMDTAVTNTKGEKLRQELQNNEALLSALASFNDVLDNDRENNRRIENQINRPIHPVEAELQAPLGHGCTDGRAEEGEEGQRLAAELDQSRKVCERMQRQFDDFA